MRLIKRSVPAWAMIITLIACASLAIGAVMYTRMVSNVATIKAAWGITLWRMSPDYLTPVEVINSIAWGELNPGELLSTNYLFGTCLKLKNDGNVQVYVAWALDGTLPSGVTLTAQYCASGSDFSPLPQNNFGIISIPPGEFSGSPLANPGRVEWILSTSPETPPGSFSFNIILKGADSSTG